MSEWRTRLKAALPPLAVDALRDLRALPRDARAAWWRATLHHAWRSRDACLPARLPARVDIVTLCYGNIYRSPLAAALLAREAVRRSWPGVYVSSAGFVPREGRPSPEDARQAARMLGVSLDAHASTRLTRVRANAATLLLVMDRQHEALLLREHPHVLGKIVRLWRFGVAAGAREEVLHDPYGRGPEAVRTCYARINAAVVALVEALAERGLTSTAAPTPES